MNRTKPLVSILLPVYNSYDFVRSEGQDLLSSALDSLLAQSYANFELIILDNQSTDKTPEVCQAYAQKDHRVHYYCDDRKRFPEGGINRLAGFASGRYCLIANDDDLWDRSYLSSLIIKMERNPQLDLAYFNGDYIDIAGHKVGKIISSLADSYSDKLSPISNFYQYVLKCNPIPLAFGLWRTESFRKMLPFVAFDDLKANTDNLFFAKFFLRGGRCQFINEQRFFYRKKGRKLDPSQIQGMPGLDKPFAIWLYYVNHQFNFYQAIVTHSQTLSLSRGQEDYIRARTLDAFIWHSIQLLDWIERDIVGKPTDKKRAFDISQSLAGLRAQLSRQLFLSSCFTDDNPDNIRFHSAIISVSLANTAGRLKEFAKVISYLQTLAGSAGVTSKKLGNNLYRIITKTEAETQRWRAINGKRPAVLLQKVSLRTISTPRSPKLSVITVSKNLGRFLEETIKSVAHQNYRNFEHIVIDGESTDNTLSILRKYPYIRWVSEEDGGYPEAFRKGLKMARGKYIIQCAVSDGLANPDWLRQCVEILDKDRQIALVWGFPQYLSEESIPGNISYPQFHDSLAPQKFDFFSYWLTTSFWFPEGNLCVRKEILDECYPRLWEIGKYTQDWLEFNYNFNTKGYLSCHVPIVANFGRTHKGQYGEREDKKGLGKKKSDQYFSKIRHYRWKLFLGITKHRFRDGKSNKLSDEFSMTRFRQTYINHWRQIILQR